MIGNPNNYRRMAFAAAQRKARLSSLATEAFIRKALAARYGSR
jgi:hypothetical protein